MSSSKLIFNPSAVLIFNQEIENGIAKQWIKSHGQMCELLATAAVLPAAPTIPPTLPAPPTSPAAADMMQKEYDAKWTAMVELWNLNFSSEKLKSDIKRMEDALEMSAGNDSAAQRAHYALMNADNLLGILQGRMKELTCSYSSGRPDGWLDAVHWWKPIYENALRKAVADETHGHYETM
jgi:hypothetical protein